MAASLVLAHRRMLVAGCSFVQTFGQSVVLGMDSAALTVKGKQLVAAAEIYSDTRAAAAQSCPGRMVVAGAAHLGQPVSQVGADHPAVVPTSARNISFSFSIISSGIPAYLNSSRRSTSSLMLAPALSSLTVCLTPTNSGKKLECELGLKN